MDSCDKNGAMGFIDILSKFTLNTKPNGETSATKF
jgi:hypothetical protein